MLHGGRKARETERGHWHLFISTGALSCRTSNPTPTTAPRLATPSKPRLAFQPPPGIRRGLELGLPGADSIVDRRIPTFSRGELPHFAGINTFLKAPYLEDVRRCGEYDVAVLGAPFDGGTTYRPGTRFGPQGIRKISALYGPYSFELGVDLRESITIADLGDVFTTRPTSRRPSTR